MTPSPSGLVAALQLLEQRRVGRRGLRRVCALARLLALVRLFQVLALLRDAARAEGAHLVENPEADELLA